MATDKDAGRDSRLLVVEDDESQLQTISALLQDEGFDVSGCATAAEATEQLDQGGIAVAVVELRLPDLAEAELLQRLESFSGDVRFIVHTGHGSFESAKNALNAGAFAYIEKGGDPAELVRHVHRAFRSRLEERTADLEAAVAQRARIVQEAFAQLKQEIQERKQAEEMLRSSEVRFRLLYERSPLGYQSLDENGRFLEVNPAWLDMLGYTREEVLGSWFGDFLAPEFVPLFRERFPRFLAAGETRGVQFEMVRKDGSQIAVEFDGKIGYDEYGHFRQTHCVGRDITEQRRAQQAIARAKEDWERTFDAVPDLIMLLDNNHRVTRVNRAQAERLNVTAGDCIGKHCYRLIHHSDEPPPNCPHTLLLKDGQEHTTQIYEPALDGDFNVSVDPLLDPEGKLVGSVHVARDVTERKRMEESLRDSERMLGKAQEIAHVGSWHLDLKRGVAVWSAEMYRIFCVQPGKFVPKYGAITEMTHPDDQAVHKPAEADCLAGRLLEPTEFRIVRPDGAVRHVQGWAEVIERDESGEPVKVLGSIQDITERKRAEEALRESESKYRSIFENSPEVVVLLDAKGTLLDVNDRAEEWLGYRKHDLLGKHFLEMPFWTDETKSKLMEMFSRRMGGASITPYEIDCICKDGTKLVAR